MKIAAGFTCATCVCVCRNVSSKWMKSCNINIEITTFIYTEIERAYDRIAYIAPLCIRFQIFTGFLWLFDQIHTDTHTQCSVFQMLSVVIQKKKRLLLDNGAPFCQTIFLCSTLSFRENTVFSHFRFMVHFFGLLGCNCTLKKKSKKRSQTNQWLMVLKRLYGLQTTICIKYWSRKMYRISCVVRLRFLCYMLPDMWCNGYLVVMRSINTPYLVICLHI